MGCATASQHSSFAGHAVTWGLLEPIGVCDTPVRLFKLSDTAWVTCTAGGWAAPLVGCTPTLVPHMWRACAATVGLLPQPLFASMHAQDCTNLQPPALQIWDYISGKLKKDLQYQAEEQFMLHDTAVLALAFSSNSDILVSGSQDGKIKVGCTIKLVDKVHCLVCSWSSGKAALSSIQRPVAMLGCCAQDKRPCRVGPLCLSVPVLSPGIFTVAG